MEEKRARKGTTKITRQDTGGGALVGSRLGLIDIAEAASFSLRHGAKNDQPFLVDKHVDSSSEERFSEGSLQAACR